MLCVEPLTAKKNIKKMMTEEKEILEILSRVSEKDFEKVCMNLQVP